MHRPSSEKLWQIPHPAALPIVPFLLDREVPLEAQDTSYRADSANTFSLSNTLSSIPTAHFVFTKIEKITAGKGIISIKSYQQKEGYHSSFTTLQGLPTAKQFAGIDFVTRLPAPMVVLSPIVTPGNIIEPPPIHTLFPNVTGAV